MPHADVHRYEGARHLVSEDAPSLVGDLLTWVADLDASAGRAASRPRHGAEDDDAAAEREPLWAALAARAAADPDGVALAEPSADGGWRTVSWSLLHRNVELLARGLAATRRAARRSRVGADHAGRRPAGRRLRLLAHRGQRRGDRLRSRRARHPPRAARGRPAPHHRDPEGDGPRARAAAAGSAHRRRRSCRRSRASERRTRCPSAAVSPDDEAVVAFTSGSTGPAKGVVYRHRQVERTRDTLREHYAITSSDALVAAFAPWAVLGPALGIASSIPDMDLTSPAHPHRPGVRRCRARRRRHPGLGVAGRVRRDPRHGVGADRRRHGGAGHAPARPRCGCPRLARRSCTAWPGCASTPTCARPTA